MGSERKIRAAESKVKRLEEELSKLDSEIARKKKELKEEENDLEAKIKDNENVHNYSGKSNKTIELLREEAVCRDHIIELYQKIIEKVESCPEPNRALPYGTIEHLHGYLRTSYEIKEGITRRINLNEERQSDEFNASIVRSSDEVVEAAKMSYEASKTALGASLEYRDAVATKLEEARKELLLQQVDVRV